MANDVTMPTNVPILNTEYIDGLYSSSWLHVVIMVFSLACKVQKLHVQEDHYANSTLLPCGHAHDTSFTIPCVQENHVKEKQKPHRQMFGA